MDPPRDRPAGRRGSDFASPDRLARVLAVALELSCRIGLLPRRSVAWPGGIRSRPVPVRQARFLRVDTTPVAALLALPPMTVLLLAVFALVPKAEAVTTYTGNRPAREGWQGHAAGHHDAGARP